MSSDLTSNEVFIVSSPISIGLGWACAPKHMTCEQVQQALLDNGPEYCPGTPWTVAPREHSREDLKSPGLCAECNHRQHWFLIGGASGVVILAMSDDTKGLPDGLKLQLGEEEEA